MITPDTSSYYCYKVIDSVTSYYAYSNTDKVLVNPSLSTLISQPSNSTLDVGQYESFNGIISGGTSPYHVTLKILNAATNSIVYTANAEFTGPAWSFNGIPSNSVWQSNSPLKANVIVTDSVYATANSIYSSSFTVNPAFSGVSLIPSYANGDINQQESITFTWSGGTSPYISNIVVMNSSGAIVANVLSSMLASTSNTLAFIPGNNAIGTLTINAIVTDSASTPTTILISNTITVNPALGIPSISPASGNYNTGNTIIITATATGGTGPYTYQWYNATAGTANAISGATTNTLSLVAGATGTMKYYVAVTDSSYLPETENSAVGLYVINPSSSTTTSTTTVTTTIAAGGGGGGGGGGGAFYSASIHPTVVHTGTNCTLTNFAEGAGETCTFGNQVFQIGEVLISLNKSETSVNNLGFILSMNNSTAWIGNYSGYSYYLKLLNLHYYNYAAGSPTVNLTLYRVPIMQPSVPKLSSISINIANAVIDKGQAIPLNISWSGGVPKYTVTYYYGNSPLCRNDNQIIAVHYGINKTYDSILLYPNISAYYCAKVYSSSSIAQANFSGTANIIVNPPLSSVLIIPYSGTYHPGQNFTLQASIFGGTPPYSYQWYNDTSGNAMPIANAVSQNYTATVGNEIKTLRYFVVVTDSASIPMSAKSGVHSYLIANAVTTITTSVPQVQMHRVAPSASNSWLILLILIIILVIILILFCLRKKKSKKSENQSASNPSDSSHAKHKSEHKLEGKSAETSFVIQEQHSPADLSLSK